MENAYGIGITNRYALFIDEEGDGDIDILKQTAEAAEKNKVKKVEVAKPASKPAVKKEVVKKDDSAGMFHAFHHVNIVSMFNAEVSIPSNIPFV